MTPIPDDRRAGVLSLASLRFHLSRAFRYGLVSGTGLALDLSLFLTLVHSGASAFVANALSSAAALTFVYLASVRRVFRYHGQFAVELFAAYVLYHLCGTAIVSAAISELVRLGVAPALAKIAILPATFGANYLFMSWLTASRERWSLRARRAPD
jgi:putative flippase GtrA